MHAGHEEIGVIHGHKHQDEPPEGIEGQQAFSLDFDTGPCHGFPLPFHSAGKACPIIQSNPGGKQSTKRV
jgi:hypothetical protein